MTKHKKLKYKKYLVMKILPNYKIKKGNLILGRFERMLNKSFVSCLAKYYLIQNKCVQTKKNRDWSKIVLLKV